ncbi:MAG: hypothetical protein A3H01_01430 [Candidatus Wildermuthbacteria bacterium RIFCSPLOWO2_12_FULL_40_9]|uniref:Uncharacterized protein n=2 Tax=Candidatus Wildermuthiibacteriota TaxID=1817923 RepID=A0A1G2REX7_9BACT|nr:MAG: hypothetical protein A3F15_00085 [Candidatus Wildermuthbacteria bacterium RIFCSPHIGHO2_12_FULL_40_12]OHA76992.1 MAG: hypothetical protein A3H01_01430 [Candidatus Wildermuthbacteria bacterium RIFCSPLOWO2_12_FULL_40_9]
MNKKISTPLGILILALVFLLASYIIFYMKASYLGDGGADMSFQKQSVTPPAATGDIDGAVDAILQESLVDEEAFDMEVLDAGLIGLDSQEISDFDQSFNETTF